MIMFVSCSAMLTQMFEREPILRKLIRSICRSSVTGLRKI